LFEVRVLARNVGRSRGADDGNPPVTTSRLRPAEARLDVWARLGLALKHWAAAAE